MASRAVVLLAACRLGLIVATAAPAEPTLSHLYPVAGQQGTTVSVTASGTFGKWPPEVWVDAPGITFKPAKEAGKFDVEIAKDAALGPHLVRIFNPQGASIPRFFIVSDEPEFLEVEPNDDFKSPQKIASLPATINGRLDKAGDVDSFGVTLKRGQTLVAWVEAYVIASTFDGMLRIVDEKGDELAFNHDGRTLDPLLAWEAPRDGTFVVQLMGFAYPATAAVQLTGGAGCVYRLHLSAGAPLRPTLPPADPTFETAPAGHSRAGGIDAVEAGQKPNDAPSEPQTVPLPSATEGRIQKSGDEHRYAFTAAKQHYYRLTVTSARPVSPLEAWLRIENKTGATVARGESPAGSREPRLNWLAPSDGVFIAAVGDLAHHGGEDYSYRLAITEAAPSVSGTAEAHSVAIQAGKTGELKATVKRENGFKAKLKLAAKGLPEGVTAADVDVPEKDGEVSLKLVADPAAKSANQPIQLILREAESGVEHPVRYMMTETSENNGVPQGYSDLVIDSTDQLWLTVIPEPAKPEAPKPEAAK
jgi:hypothetical protein